MNDVNQFIKYFKSNKLNKVNMISQFKTSFKLTDYLQSVDLL